MPGIKPPNNIIPSKTTISDFFLRLEAFDDYVVITEKNPHDARLRSLFLALGGMELRQVVKGLHLADDKFATLRNAFKHYFQPIKNVVLKRHKFFNIVRTENEELSAYLVRLKTHAELCDFENTNVDTFTN